MHPIRALRHLIANSDRLVESNERLVQGVGNQAASANERLDRLCEAADNAPVNERLDRLYLAADNLARDLNKRLDQLIKMTEYQRADINTRLDRVTKAIAGQPAPPFLHSTPASASVHDSGLHGNVPQGQNNPQSSRAEPKSNASNVRANTDWLNSPSPASLPLPRWSNAMLKKRAEGTPLHAPTNALQEHQPLLEALEPWQGFVPKGYSADFFGILTDTHFRTMYGADPETAGGTYVKTEFPPIHGSNGEWWFEAINWIEAAREARGRFVMITSGACYGAQAVGAYRALQIVNPLPCKLVAVEPVPENYLWVRKHFRDNGIDPDAHWLVRAAISDVNDPILFPVGGAGWGANNCMSTDKPAERQILADELISQGKAADALRNLILNNTTGVITNMVPEKDVSGEIKIISAVTLGDLLSAFDLVDYLEADIQQSEARVFPPFIDLLRKKVRRIHIGTHGADNHDMLASLFAKHGWEIVFAYAPNATYDSEIGQFELNDGVLTVRNPDL
jgi:hypothetical protein